MEHEVHRINFEVTQEIRSYPNSREEWYCETCKKTILRQGVLVDGEWNWQVYNERYEQDSLIGYDCLDSGLEAVVPNGVRTQAMLSEEADAVRKMMDRL